MFQFPRFPVPALCVQAGLTGHDSRRVSPFGYLRINAWLAAPRSFSQPPTSFVGSWCLGIHRVPLVTCRISDLDDQMLALAMEFSRVGETRLRPPGSRAAGGSGVSCVLKDRAFKAAQRAHRLAPLRGSITSQTRIESHARRREAHPHPKV